MLLATRGVASSSRVSWFFIEVKSSGMLPVVKPCITKVGLACLKSYITEVGLACHKSYITAEVGASSLALSLVSLLQWGSLALIPVSLKWGSLALSPITEVGFACLKSYH